jgi:hypothetical protein
MQWYKHASNQSTKPNNNSGLVKGSTISMGHPEKREASLEALLLYRHWIIREKEGWVFF